MTALEAIKTQVDLRLSHKHKDVIVGVYRSLILAHNDFCGCNYCKILEEYVRQKKSMHAIHSYMDDPDYPYYDGRVTSGDYTKICEIDRLIRGAKQKKDLLKMEAHNSVCIENGD